MQHLAFVPFFLCFSSEKEKKIRFIRREMGQGRVLRGHSEGLFISSFHRSLHHRADMHFCHGSLKTNMLSREKHDCVSLAAAWKIWVSQSHACCKAQCLFPLKTHRGEHLLHPFSAFTDIKLNIKAFNRD